MNTKPNREYNVRFLRQPGRFICASADADGDV